MPSLLRPAVAELDYHPSSSLGRRDSTAIRLFCCSRFTTPASRAHDSWSRAGGKPLACPSLVANPGHSQLLELVVGSAKDPNNRHNYLSTVNSFPTRAACR